MTVLTDTFTSATSIATRFGSLRARMADAVAKRKTYLTTLRELENLTTRELADLGIAPSNIQTIAREAAYGA